MASRLIRPAVALRPTASSTPMLRRSFAVTSVNRIKESSGGSPFPPLPARRVALLNKWPYADLHVFLGVETKDYETHKQDSLSKQKTGKGHWKPELASDGEEAVKADRTPDEDISKLQERTKKHVEDKSKSGTSGTDPM